MSGKRQFVHLHNHSEYSLLDGAQRIPILLDRAVELGMPAVALTDHGNLFGAVRFHDEARKRGIKPILGCEVYVAPGDRRDRTPPREGGKPYHHLILLAEDDRGWANLVKLVSAGYEEGFYYRPRIDHELLAQHSEGLIGTSACLAGEIPTLLRRGQVKEAERRAGLYRDILGEGSFFLELQDQGIPEEKELNPRLLRLAKKLDLPLVATNDVHFPTREHHKAHDVLIRIQTGATVEQTNSLSYSTQHYFKSAEEMERLFGDVPEALDNTLLIAERCDASIPEGEFHLPDFEIPEGFTPESYLREVVEQGYRKRQETWKALEARGALRRPIEAYRERLEHELDVITRVGFTGYFLVVGDFIHYARDCGIPVGPGRGSAAGSLVAYCMEVTDIDPLQYGLIFERFLNEERLEPPDIDIDFCQRDRGKVIEYVTEKYGRENVCQIITFGAMKTRQVIRDVARVLEMSYAEADRLAKLVPETPGTTLDQAIKSSRELREMQQKDPRVADLLDTAHRLEGLVRHASVHAAGVVIAPRPLKEFVPLFKTNRDELTTQWAMKEVARIGLLKMDFLGLRTLTVIADALRSIERQTGERLDIDHLPLNVDDAPEEELKEKVRETYRLFAQARTSGIFQFESSGMRDVLRRVRPERFEELIALNAVYRPGPIESGMVDEYIERHRNPKKVRYLLPELEQVLEETHGVIVYQEQVMEIARLLAGFTLTGADTLRKAMGKKDEAMMADQGEKFLAGCAAQNVPGRIARELWNHIEKFAGYGFNKSHSTAYARVAYQTAWLKTHYPQHFMAALLTSEKENTDKCVGHIHESVEMGIPVLPPDLNRSELDFAAVGEEIRFGLSAVKGVGQSAVESILEARERLGGFESFQQLVEEIDLRLCNRKVIESLIKAGCFDSMGYRRGQLFANVEGALEHGAKVQQDRASGQTSLFGGVEEEGISSRERLHPAPDWTDREMLAFEKETLGYYLSGHPLAEHRALVEKLSDTTIGSLEEAGGKEVSLCGVITRGKRVRTRKGDTMFRGYLEDWEGSVELVVFPKTYQEWSHACQDEAVVFIRGRVEAGGGPVKLLASEILPLEEARHRTARKVVVTLDVETLEEEQLLDAESAVRSHRGEVPLEFRLAVSSGQVTVRAGHIYRVEPSTDLRAELESLLPAGRVDFVYETP